MNLGLQAPICGIRQKCTKDATQVYRKSNPASNLQRGPTRQSKRTNKTPAPTYSEEGPPTSHPSKGSGQRWQCGAGRTPGSAEPGRVPVPPQLWKEGCHRHPNIGYQHSRPYLTREPTSPHYKRASTHPLKALNSFHSFHSYTQGGGVGLHLYQ